MLCKTRGKIVKIWEIQYTQNGGATASIQCESGEKPSREHAAQQLRDALFQPFLIPDTTRDINDKTVWQLEKLGVHIVDIVEIPTH